MSLTKKTEYALRALCEITISGNGKPLSRKIISKNQNISEHILEQIFVLLQKEGIVKSVRGPGGGFLLNKNKSEITVWDIYSVVEETENFYNKCAVRRNEVCKYSKNCNLRNIWNEIDISLKETMTKIFLTDIVNE